LAYTEDVLTHKIEDVKQQLVILVHNSQSTRIS
jgi:hypothetical protein